MDIGMVLLVIVVVTAMVAFFFKNCPPFYTDTLGDDSFSPVDDLLSLDALLGLVGAKTLVWAWWW